MLTRLLIATAASLALSTQLLAEDVPPLPEERQPEPVMVQLAYQFKVGQFMHYETESSTSMIIAAKEFKQSTRTSEQSKKHYRVVSASDDGSAVLETVIDEAIMEVRGDDDKPVRFDSRDSGVPLKAFLATKNMIGRAVRMRCKPNGSAIEVLPTTAGGQPVQADASQATFLTVLPEGPVKVGDSWTDDFSASVSMRFSETRIVKKSIPIRRRYTLATLEDGVATIEFRTYPLEVVHEPSVQVQLIQRWLTGHVKFDVQAGKQLEIRSSGSNIVHKAIGESSSVQASATNFERYVASPQPSRKPAGPVGPIGPVEAELPGPAKLSVATK